jgi:hypothetical protein
MQNRPVIQLLDSIGTSLIVEWPSGIWYSNQTGGTSCLHPLSEGVLVPIGNDFALDPPKLLGIEDDLIGYFSGPPWNGSGATTGITRTDADAIDRILSRNMSFTGIRVDRGRLLESHEAWVHVTMDPDTGPYAVPQLLDGFDPFPRRAVLTWSNSD